VRNAELLHAKDLLATLPRALPVIVLTAHDDRNLRDKALRLGAFAFLTKPFRASELVETIKKALGSS
jgi:FixJ family two-component response regulator